jgi:hypothetical protein
VIERLLPPLRRVQRNGELLLDPFLPDEIVEPPRSQRLLEILFVRCDRWSEKLCAQQCPFQWCC